MENANGLKYGTRVRTKAELGPTTGMLIVDRHLDARRPDALGLITHYVPGHGGDVWFVRHEEGDSKAEPSPVAAYSYTEFELED